MVGGLQWVAVQAGGAGEGLEVLEMVRWSWLDGVGWTELGLWHP